MFVVAAVSQKGGAGKTTVAVNLAVMAERAGLATVILDLDPQASSAHWGDRRTGQTPVVVAAQASRLARHLDDARRAGAGVAIIDTPPAADNAAMVAAKAADLVLVPVRPSALDLDALEATLTITSLARKPTWVIINGVAANSRTGNDMEKALADLKVDIAPVWLGQRVDYSVPMSAGQTVVEWAPTGRSAAEVTQLWDWLRAKIGRKPGGRTATTHRQGQVA